MLLTLFQLAVGYVLLMSSKVKKNEPKEFLLRFYRSNLISFGNKQKYQFPGLLGVDFPRGAVSFKLSLYLRAAEFLPFIPCNSRGE